MLYKITNIRKEKNMGTFLKENELNQIAKGTKLFRKGERVTFIGMVVKGSILVESKGMKRIAKKGEMVAVTDLFVNAYLGNYTTEEDTILYAFPAANEESLENFLNSNMDYRGIIVRSMENELLEYLEEREHLLSRAVDLHSYLQQHYSYINKAGITDTFIEEFLIHDPEESFALDCREEKISFYQESANVPEKVHNQFYYYGDRMALYQISELAYMIQNIMESYEEIIKYLEEIFDVFWNKNGQNLFDLEVQFAKEAKKNAKFEMVQLVRINDTKDKLYTLFELYEKLTGKKLPLNKNYLEEQFASVMNAPVENNTDIAEEVVEDKPKENPMVVLKGSLLQILKFAEVEAEEQKEIITVINAFVNAKDRLSTQDDVRRIKKQITTEFYKLYKVCIFKWFENPNVPLAVELFLNYGYIDERLLDQEQIEYLADMVSIKNKELPFPIYTMPEWLKEIYEGRKETSRNSFEQDYRDELRENKRTGKITEKEEKEFLNDNRRKVIFEIENMFVSNNKMVNGKLSTYVPILYKDEIYGDIKRLFLTKEELSDAIIELEKKDFTTFYREVLYTNPELKIEKEYVIKRVYPDVIIAPVYGTASSMWQEITGKKRDTPARFIFPSITENEVYKLVAKAFGRFHWEYCRCEQGTAWNNIQYKSLTSEYMDYIQYYRKNHELSEEKREKIKAQIQRARNNSREIFLSDYELWVFSESKSAIKLNKVSRNILATYCPFSKEIRESLKANVVFAEAMMRQQRMFGEKVKEWDMRIKRRENNNLEVPEEFYQTYEYYASN